MNNQNPTFASTNKIKSSFTRLQHPNTDALGKVPPQDIDTEASVLGTIMLDKSVIENVADVLRPEHFYKLEHQEIYKAILVLFDKEEVVDMLTVANALKSIGTYESIGGSPTLVKLTQRISGTENINAHARIVIEQSIKREMIKISSETMKDSYEGISSAFDILDKASENIFKLSESNIRKDYDKVDMLLKKAIDEMEERKNTKDKFTGLPTGFIELDRLTGGLQKSDLIILAARPGMGKSAFAISLLLNTAIDHENPVAIFSLEMSPVQVTNRMISIQGEISASNIKTGDLEEHEWTQMMQKTKKLANANIFVDGTPALSVMELKAKARRLKHKHDIKLIIIDYLQLMTSANKERTTVGNREQEIAYISRSLKGIAKELDIPIIALAQLSRAVETRGGNKKPTLSDLRESGSIEQDADIVSFIYRANYYDFLTDEDDNATKDMAELIISKHRNGSLGTVKLRFIEHLTKFTNLDDYDNLSNNDENAQEYQSKINLDSAPNSYIEKEPNIGNTSTIIGKFDNSNGEPGF